MLRKTVPDPIGSDWKSSVAVGWQSSTRNRQLVGLSRMQTPSKLRLCWMMKFIGVIRRCQAVKTFINKNGQLEVYPPRDRQPVYVGVGVAWWDHEIALWWREDKL